MVRARLLFKYLCCVAALCWGALSAAAQDAPIFLQDRYFTSAAAGKTAPPITLHSATGEPLALDSLRGHPVLLLYWATWCGNCKVGLADLPALQRDLPAGATILAVDFDRDPAAATAFLAKEHIPLRDFHDNPNFREPGSLHVSFHLHSQPYPMSILIDADGTVVYCEQSMFREELHAAIAAMGPKVTLLIPGEHGEPDEPLHPVRSGPSVAEVRAAAKLAMVSQTGYLEGQKQYRCRYAITTRDEYGGGISQHAAVEVDEIFANDGHQLESHPVASGETSQPKPSAPPPAANFAVWTNPILGELLDHSILSNITKTRSTSVNDGLMREFVRFTVRGDPAFTPSSDLERIAQSVEGAITLDLTDEVFLQVDAIATYDVVAGGRFLMQRDMPILGFRTAFFEGAELPGNWTVASYSQVPAGPDQGRAWLSGLTRTFGQRQSCERYSVTTRILPADDPAPAPQ